MRAMAWRPIRRTRVISEAIGRSCQHYEDRTPSLCPAPSRHAVGIGDKRRPLCTLGAQPDAASTARGSQQSTSSPNPAPTPPFQLDIIYQDEHLVAVEKPSGCYVHPPEAGFSIPDEENMMKIVRTQLGGAWLWPVHRLDRPTSGVLVFCLTKEAASGFGELMMSRQIDKTYIAMTRGFAAPHGIVDKELDGATAVTLYETLATTELPIPVSKYPVARYSLLKVKLLTGAYHQIRRHLVRIDRPIIGDTTHGDRPNNRLWMGERFGCPGMFLKCAEMAFEHPVRRGERLILTSSHWEHRWHVAFDAFGLCPVAYHEGFGEQAAAALGLSYEDLRQRVVDSAAPHFDGRGP